MDKTVRSGAEAKQVDHDRAMLDYIMDYGTYKINGWLRGLRENPDGTMLKAAEKTWEFGETLPNSDYYIPESTPNKDALGKGKVNDQEGIQQFGGGSLFLQQEETTTH